MHDHLVVRIVVASDQQMGQRDDCALSHGLTGRSELRDECLQDDIVKGHEQFAETGQQISENVEGFELNGNVFLMGLKKIKKLHQNFLYVVLYIILVVAIKLMPNGTNVSYKKPNDQFKGFMQRI